MTQLTAFGPQGPNYTTTRPAADPAVSGGLDTWMKNCSVAGATDGTYPTADFFNVIIANLRTAVSGTLGNAALTGHDDMLYNAIQSLSYTNNVATPTQIETGSGNGLIEVTNFATACAAGLQYPITVTTNAAMAAGTAVIHGEQLGAGAGDGVKGEIIGPGNGTGVTGAVTGGGIGNGVHGIITNAGQGSAVWGQNQSTAAMGAAGFPAGDGVTGSVEGASNGCGVHGMYEGTGTGSGVLGEVLTAGPSNGLGQNNGVWGLIAASAVNAKGCGVLGQVANGGPGSGVHGLVTSGSGHGCYGEQAGNSSGTGVWGNVHGGGTGHALYGTVTSGTGAGVYASAAAGYAGYFVGSIYTSGGVTSSDSTLKMNQAPIVVDHASELSKKIVWKDYLKFKDPHDHEKINAHIAAHPGGEKIKKLDTALTPDNKSLVVGEQAGVIAQELQALTKSLGYAEYLVGTSPSGKLTVDYNSLFSIVLAGLSSRIGALETAIAVLAGGTASS